jgi:hypothetical protein
MLDQILLRGLLNEKTGRKISRHCPFKFILLFFVKGLNTVYAYMCSVYVTVQYTMCCCIFVYTALQYIHIGTVCVYVLYIDI